MNSLAHTRLEEGWSTEQHSSEISVPRSQSHTQVTHSALTSFLFDSYRLVELPRHTDTDDTHTETVNLTNRNSEPPIPLRGILEASKTPLVTQYTRNGKIRVINPHPNDSTQRNFCSATVLTGRFCSPSAQQCTTRATTVQQVQKARQCVVNQLTTLSVNGRSCKSLSSRL